MPRQQRFKTKYKGVYFINGAMPNGNSEKIFYIRYLKNGVYVEERAGRSIRDDMTPARAANIRIRRINGEMTNQEVRETRKKEELENQEKWTISRLYEAYKKNNPDLKGWVTYESAFRKHVGPYFGHLTPGEITSDDIDAFTRDLFKRKLSPQTAKHQVMLLSRVVNHGVEKGYCTGFNFKIKAPEVSNQRKEMLNKDEILRLIQAISKEENLTVGRIMLLALYSGMRKGEILKLKWSDINFETGFITLRNAKSGDDEIIPLNSPSREVLANIEIGDSEFVFPGKNGKKHLVNVTNGLHRIRDAAQLPPGFRPLHGLRHTYASILASSGEVDMYTLQKLLTHRDAKTTQRYAHLRDEALKKAADSASNIFRKIQNDSNQVIE